MKYVGHGSYNDHEFFIKDHFYMGPTKSTQGNKESNWPPFLSKIFIVNFLLEGLIKTRIFILTHTYYIYPYVFIFVLFDSKFSTLE